MNIVKSVGLSIVQFRKYLILYKNFLIGRTGVATAGVFVTSLLLPSERIRKWRRVNVLGNWLL